MRKTWIDRVLSHLSRLQAGSTNLQGLVESVATTRDGFRQQLETFRASWPDNPEVSQSEASHIERSLVDLGDILSALDQALRESSRPLNWSAWIERIRPPLESLRQQRLKMQSWPTSNEIVNRLLRHLDYWRAGHPAGAMTRQLLDQTPLLEDHWDALIARFDIAQQEELWSSLDPVLRIFEQWRINLDVSLPAESARWSEEIVDSLKQFDQLLVRLVEPELASGPTAFPVINLLLSASDQVLEGSAGWPQLHALAQSAAQLFQLQVDAPTLAQSKMVECLQEVENLSAQDQVERFREVMAALIRSSQELARLNGAEELVNLKTSDAYQPEQNQLNLPPMLSSLYELAADYVDGRTSAEALRPGILQLQAVVNRFSVRPAGQAEVALALGDLTETVAILQDLEASPSRSLLVELEEVLQDCAESLASLQSS